MNELFDNIATALEEHATVVESLNTTKNRNTQKLVKDLRKIVHDIHGWFVDTTEETVK